MSVETKIVCFLKKCGVNGISIKNNDIVSTCPVHKNKNNKTVFRIEKIPPYRCNCFSCGFNGTYSSLYYKLTGSSDNIEIITEPKTISDEYHSFVESCITLEKPIKSDNQQPLYDYLEKRKRENHNVLNIPHIVNKYHLFYCDKGTYRRRIIMPIFMNGEIVSYNNRAVYNTKLKCLNVKGAKFSNYLYGFDQAIDKKICILCESAFDIFQFESILRPNSKYGIIALMGTVWNKLRRDLILQNFNNVIIWLHNDKTGEAASVKIYNDLSEYCNVKYASTFLFDRNDPGESKSSELIQILKTIKFNSYEHFV